MKHATDQLSALLPEVDTVIGFFLPNVFVGSLRICNYRWDQVLLMGGVGPGEADKAFFAKL
jgi:hypothetical protein